MTKEHVAAAKHYWSAYLSSRDWRQMTLHVEPKSAGCGQIYELPELTRPDQDICIADMHDLAISEPHYHPPGNYEIYIVMQGTADLIVGRTSTRILTGNAVVIPPSHVHYAIPSRDFVTAAINLPGYRDENYIVTTHTNEAVGFDLDIFRLQEREAAKNRLMTG